MSYSLRSITPEGVIERSKKQTVRFMFIFCVILGILLFAGCNSVSSGESDILRKLRATELILNGRARLIQTSYFFYPSTMRMVNVDDMPNWNEAIKDVQRLSVLSMWPDRFDQSKQEELVGDLEAKENFSLYAEMDDQHSDFKLLGRKNGSELVLVYHDSTANYIVHLLGKVNYVKLMKLAGDLQDEDKSGTGISFLTKAMKQNTDRAVGRRRYYERREKIKAAEKLRKDSIEAAMQASETAITE